MFYSFFLFLNDQKEVHTWSVLPYSPLLVILVCVCVFVIFCCWTEDMIKIIIILLQIYNLQFCSYCLNHLDLDFFYFYLA